MEQQGGSSSISSVNQDTFHLHKTKCAVIIKNFIAPALLTDLIKDFMY